MSYKVIVTIDAEEDLECSLRYLLFQKNNRQAAKNVLNDFEETKNKLKTILFLSIGFFMNYRIMKIK